MYKNLPARHATRLDSIPVSVTDRSSGQSRKQPPIPYPTLPALMLLATAAVVISQPLDAAELGASPVAWQPMTIDVRGPMASEGDESPNPFLDLRLDVTLTGPTGESWQVPGYFAGNGQGSGNGNVWRARFTPDLGGEWTYAVSFVEGDEIAVADDASAGTGRNEHGASGSFVVAAPDPDADGWLGNGRLAYVGEHYLREADGDFWIKGGIDSPENFFGYAGFDNTVDQSGGAGTTGLTDGLHRYAPHVADWREGDPLFVSADSGIDSKGIIGAINYLAGQSVNSLYFLPMNLGGDGRETYPFVGPSGSVFDDTHYDVSKLHQWNQVLAHMQRRGIAAHVVLAEREVDNTAWFDDGELGTERKLYHREMIARFTYLNALKWNLSEESRFDADHHRAFARHIRALDWAAHPIAVHTVPNDPYRHYNDLLGNTDFDISSIQYSPKNANLFTEQWRERTREAGWPWVIDMDEIGPAGVGLTGSNADELRRTVLYPVYFSGGNLEWYFGYHALPLGGDMRTENFRTREPMYRYMRFARQFMLEHLPFQAMSPADDALVGAGVGDQVFALEGKVYAIYLARGDIDARLTVPDGRYRLRWFDPRNGGFVGDALSLEGSQLDLGRAPEAVEEDWVLLVEQEDDVTEPVDPEESVDPSEPVDPEEPSEPPDPEEPVTPGEPTEPETPDPDSTEGEAGAPELGAAVETPTPTTEGGDGTGNSDGDADGDKGPEGADDTAQSTRVTFGGPAGPLTLLGLLTVSIIRRRR